MTIEERIKQHEALVTGSISKRYATCCPRCDCNEGFQRHEIRRRTFYCQLEGGRAAAVKSWLVRWRCFRCRTRFTDYPPFALPYKRHVKSAIFEMATKILRERRATYRSSAGSQAGHSSLWRWLEWLSDLYEKGNACLKFIITADPNSILHRKDYFVDPRKSRSKSRASVVEIAFQTLDRIMAFERLAAEKYSPSLEHVHASG